MNKSIKIVTFLMSFMSLSMLTYAQGPPDWNTQGNNVNHSEWFGADDNSIIPVRFRHEADDAVSRFEWYTHDGTSIDERMRLTRAGWLGLGTQTPFRKFHIHESDDPSVEIRINPHQSHRSGTLMTY